MIERQPVFGGILFLFGLYLVAYNKKGARQFEESQKSLGSWGMKKHAYIFWRIVSIGVGVMSVLLGALMMV
jgi:hypothetical protein